MFHLENEKKIEPSDIFLNPFFENKTINKKDTRKKNIFNLSHNTFSLSKKFHQEKLDKNINNLPNPTLVEMELTPKAKRYIKSLLFPFAAFSYILQKSSVAFGKVVAAVVSFSVFSLVNCISSASINAYEVKLPLVSICLVGSILGARDLIHSIKKIILSIPYGIQTCYQNIFCDECSILDFICGIDKVKNNIVKKFSKKFF